MSVYFHINFNIVFLAIKILLPLLIKFENPKFLQNAYSMKITAIGTCTNGSCKALPNPYSLVFEAMSRLHVIKLFLFSSYWSHCMQQTRYQSTILFTQNSEHEWGMGLSKSNATWLVTSKDLLQINFIHLQFSAHWVVSATPPSSCPESSFALTFTCQ